jgi:hypothetical protein
MNTAMLIEVGSGEDQVLPTACAIETMLHPPCWPSPEAYQRHDQAVTPYRARVSRLRNLGPGDPLHVPRGASRYWPKVRWRTQLAYSIPSPLGAQGMQPKNAAPPPVRAA